MESHLYEELKYLRWVCGQCSYKALHKADIEPRDMKIQKQRELRPSPSAEAARAPSLEPDGIYSVTCTMEAFGDFGAPRNESFCCPKCNILLSEEEAMKDHLELELNKIRWCCSKCSRCFQTYHEAHLHSKSNKNQAQPVRAVRSPTMRSAWINHTIESQKQDLCNIAPRTALAPQQPKNNENNSLLVVRYTEPIPMPEQFTDQPTPKRKKSSRNRRQ